MSLVSGYAGYRELYTNLTLRELRSKYKRSFLGWTWSLVNPLVNMTVYTVVFSVFLKARLAPGEPSGLHVFALYLLCGLLPWNYFSSAVNGSIGSIVGNSNLIKKTYFPRQLIPASSVGAALVTHLIEMGLLLVVMLAFGNWRAVVFVPVVLLLIAITTVAGLGLGLLLSVLNVYFRDIEHFTGILFLVWFYATPIVYPFGVIHSHTLQEALKVNPMTDIVLAFQASLYDGRWPSALGVAYGAGFAIVALLVGSRVFTAMEGRLAEEL